MMSPFLGSFLFNAGQGEYTWKFLAGWLGRAVLQVLTLFQTRLKTWGPFIQSPDNFWA